MTKAELRVAVAKDVIKSMKYQPERGHGWIDETDTFPTTRELTTRQKNEIQKDSRKAAKLIRKHCYACALGSCFLSLVAIDNKFKFKLGGYDRALAIEVGTAISDIFTRLSKAFTPSQLALIENAYERGSGGLASAGRVADKIPLSESEYRTLVNLFESDRIKRAVDFGFQYEDRKKRMIAIMKNIIKNNGTFKP